MAAGRATRLASRLSEKGPILSLDQFMTRSKVLQLYRDILRNAKHLEKSDADYIRQWARADFERFRNEKDPERIKSLLNQGKAQLRTLEMNVTLSKAKF
ncbi:hypothetical protein HK104_005136 [Borealophlyctis nickersoniae]|nr:hypothetical protein HK104_005136 [Borealophlyctis nickersoniae]